MAEQAIAEHEFPTTAAIEAAFEPSFHVFADGSVLAEIGTHVYDPVHQQAFQRLAARPDTA